MEGKLRKWSYQFKNNQSTYFKKIWLAQVAKGRFSKKSACQVRRTRRIQWTVCQTKIPNAKYSRHNNSPNYPPEW